MNVRAIHVRMELHATMKKTNISANVKMDLQETTVKQVNENKIWFVKVKKTYCKNAWDQYNISFLIIPNQIRYFWALVVRCSLKRGPVYVNIF